jgi:predicted amidohydrolase YtcJ
VLVSPPEHGTGFFRTQGVKLFADGALGSRGAALLAPYADDPRNVGLVMHSRAEIAAAARRAHAAGYQLTTHAIGDRGVRAVLDAYADALGPAAPRLDHRFRVEHAQVVSPEDRPRFASLGVIASMQPTHATSDAPWAPARLGPERLSGAYAWRTLTKAGARIAFGSDFPVEAPSPLLGLYAATTRKDAEGKPAGGFRAQERLSLPEAIRAYTVGAAHAAHADADRGTIAAGKLADLTVIDLTPAQAEALEPLRTARVHLTIVGGRVQFERRKNE